MELVPRLSKVQSMDTLSSQATVDGFKATLLAADALGKFMPILDVDKAQHAIVIKRSRKQVDMHLRSAVL